MSHKSLLSGRWLQVGFVGALSLPGALQAQTTTPIVPSISITGSLSRDTTVSNVTFTVVAAGYTTADAANAAANTAGASGVQAGLFNALNFFLPATSQSTTSTTNGCVTNAVPYVSDQSTGCGDFYIQPATSATVTADPSGTTYDVTQSLVLYAKTTAAWQAALTTKNGATTLPLTISYLDAAMKAAGQSSPSPQLEHDDIKRLLAVPSEAPDIKDVTPTDHGLYVTWNSLGNVTYVGPNGGSLAEPKVVVMALPVGSNPVSLPAHTFNQSTGADSSATCTFQPLTQSGGECIVCPDSTYVDVNAFKAATGADPYYEDPSVGSITISSLDPANEYAVFSQYYPDGITRSACINAKPANDATLVEANNGPKMKMTDPRCFIATAAYGNPMDKHLVLLRWFRDHVLLHTNAGKAFVHTYYRLSPPVAHVIAQSEPLRALTRAGLWPLIGVCYLWQWGFFHPDAALAAMVVLALGAALAAGRKAKAT